MNHYCANYIKHRSGMPAPDDYLGNLEALYENEEGQSIRPET